MNIAADQDLRTALLESCHPATLAALLQTPRDPQLLQKILETDAAACAVAVEALRQHDAAIPTSWSTASLAKAVETSGLYQALTHIALHRLSAPLPIVRKTALHQAHQQSLTRAHLARQLAQDLGYLNDEEAYLMGLLLHADQLLPATSRLQPAGEHSIVMGWFERWKFPVAAKDALRYRNIAIADLQGLHLLTLVLRLADDYSDAGRRAFCPPSPVLQQAMTDAAHQAAQQLPETADSILISTLAATLNMALPIPVIADEPSWATELRATLGPIALHRFSLDETRQLLQGEKSHPALFYLRIPVDENLSVVAAALLGNAWTSFNSAAAADSTSRIDEQICRLIERAHFVAIPAQDAVWIAGLDDDQWLQYHAKQEQLHACALRTAAPSISPALNNSVSLQFCREVLHEASAPLTTVRNYLYVLNQQAPESAREELGLIRTELDRLSSILQQLRGTPKSGASGLRLINRVVQDAVRSLQIGRGTDATIEMDLDESLNEADVTANVVQQILINLMQNALDTAPPASHLMVSTRRLLSASHSPRVQIEVADNGPGLPAEIQAQLFEPKAQFQPGHSGLGLSIVRKLVAQLGGDIDCSSTARGTRFQMVIPLLPPQEIVHGSR